MADPEAGPGPTEPAAPTRPAAALPDVAGLFRWEVARLRAAFHEVGHAVAVYLLGGDVSEVRIFQKRILGPWGGVCVPGIVTPAELDRLSASENVRLAAAAVYMAGVVAEDLLHAKHSKGAWLNDSLAWADSDIAGAEAALPDGQARGRGEARRMLNEPCAWSVVEVIAGLLFDRGPTDLEEISGPLGAAVASPELRAALVGLAPEVRMLLPAEAEISPLTDEPR